jgi:Alginate export
VLPVLTLPADRPALLDNAIEMDKEHFNLMLWGALYERRQLPLKSRDGTGDLDAADGKWGRFDSLFGHRRAELGPTGIYGALARENIDTLAVRLSIVPHSRHDAFAAYRVVRLAAPADAFAGTGVRDPSGRSGRDGAQQLDVRFRSWLAPDRLRLDVGATYLVPGGFLRDAPNATRSGDTMFSYGDLTYTFRSSDASR